MAEIYRVQNVSEALKLASEFKEKGQYDWFRGQSGMWPLKSTIARESEHKRAVSMQRFQSFFEWTKNHEELSYLTDKPDNLIAVAQHYGLSTNFIDFTTEPSVAAFFAGKSKTTQDESCIICLNTKDFLSFSSYFKVLSQENALNDVIPELLTLSVSNLWRLEAQYGVFLISPYANLEDFYDMDRIVFPAGKAFIGKNKNEIYPERKSNLELLLDSYFMVEKLNNSAFQSLISNEDNKIKKYHIKPDPSFCNLDIVRKIVPIHSSWIEPEKVSDWSNFVVESYFEIAGQHVAIIFNQEDEKHLIEKDFIKNKILTMLKDRILLRNKIHTFQVLLSHYNEKKLNEISQNIHLLWDGLRHSPCSDEELAKAFENLILLSLNQTTGEMLQVEFGYSDGSYARAKVPLKNIEIAVREDISEYVREDRHSDIRTLLQGIYAPQRLFCFRLFAQMYVEDIVPYQIISRTYTLYSPIKIKTFGLP